MKELEKNIWYTLDSAYNAIPSFFALRSVEDRPDLGLREDIGKYHVSTVFLALDHNMTGKGNPILFETMIFGEGELDNYCRRYETYTRACLGHKAIVKGLKRRHEKESNNKEI